MVSSNQGLSRIVWHGLWSNYTSVINPKKKSSYWSWILKRLLTKWNTWINWMTSIFQSRTSAILLNEVSGKTFHRNRGVMQGDSLSPFFLCPSNRFLTNSSEQGYTGGSLKVTNTIQLRDQLSNSSTCRWYSDHNGGLQWAAKRFERYSQCFHFGN